MTQAGRRDCIDLGPQQVMQQRKIMEVLTSSVKRRILWHLMREGPLTAKDLASRLGVSLPTILEHLESLTASGLVGVEENRLTGKKYSLTTPCVSMTVSLEEHVQTDEDAVRSLARAYLSKKLEDKDLGFPISVRDVARTLGVDRRTAAQVAGLLNSDKSLIQEQLEPLILETLRDSGEKSLSQLSRELGVDTGVITMAVTSLAEKGLLAFTPRGRLVAVARREERG